MNAIEYALESNADLQVIGSMQKACRDDWRGMKAQQIGKRHNDLEQDLERQQSKLQNELELWQLAMLKAHDGSLESKNIDTESRPHLHQSTASARIHTAITA